MVEADSHLKVLPSSILDIYKEFECIDVLSIRSWLAMSANVSVGYTPQKTDIFVCLQHVGCVMSANFFGCLCHVGETCCRHTLLYVRRNQY